MGFNDLKKQSSLGNLTAKLVKEVEKQNNTGGGADERLWKPEMDKTGNGYAVIRFLRPDGEDLPWVKLFSPLQGPGGWYIENSLTTIGGKDPVGELNRELWNSGTDANKDIVRKQKRKLSSTRTSMLFRTKPNPQNEGKVFLYKFGKKIFDKIMEAYNLSLKMKPLSILSISGVQLQTETEEGSGYWNYDSSEFDRVSPLLDDDDALGPSGRKSIHSRLWLPRSIQVL